MRDLFFLSVLLLLTMGCASSGYNPHYIISDAAKEEAISHWDAPVAPTAF